MQHTLHDDSTSNQAASQPLQQLVVREKNVSSAAPKLHAMVNSSSPLLLLLQIIVKEKGVFSNVTSPSTKAKLRILFEVAPLGLLVEKGGGAARCYGRQKSTLDVEITKHDQVSSRLGLRGASMGFSVQ